MYDVITCVCVCVCVFMYFGFVASGETEREDFSVKVIYYLAVW